MFNKTKVFGFFFVVLALFSMQLQAREIGYDYPEVTAKALKNSKFHLLIDPDTGEVLLSENPDKRVAPSSMTKLMTAYVVFDKIKRGVIQPDQKCVVGRNAWRKAGSTMFLDYGDVVTIDQLLKGLLVVSGNDASVVLAESTAGSVDEFAYLMNLKARELGLKNSQFKNPHGLSENGHYMSMRDLATLVTRMYKDFPEYSKYMGIESFTYGQIRQLNRNPLIKSNYDGILGGKTGHTDAGGYGVVAAVKRDDRRLIAVMNKADRPSVRSAVIEELFDYGFSQYNKITLYKKGQVAAKVRTWLGETSLVDAVINETVAFNIPVQKSLDTIVVKVKYMGPVHAPIHKGDKVATLFVDVNGREHFEYDLLAKYDVKEAGYFQKVNQVLRYKVRTFLNKISKK